MIFETSQPVVKLQRLFCWVYYYLLFRFMYQRLKKIIIDDAENNNLTV